MTTSFRHPTFGRLVAERTDNGWGLTAAPADEPDTNAVDDALASAARRDECFAAIDAMTAEIERLREARARTSAELGNTLADKIDLRDERDRYRRALEQIASTPGTPPTVQLIARRALAGE